MNVLLDTHVWIWRLLEPERLPRGLDERLAAPECRAFLSPISVWETMVLARKGRLDLEPDARSWIRTALRKAGIAMAPLTHDVAMRSESLPGFDSQDPADRFLVATALEADLAMATVDRAMLAYEPLTVLA